MNRIEDIARRSEQSPPFPTPDVEDVRELALALRARRRRLQVGGAIAAGALVAATALILVSWVGIDDDENSVASTDGGGGEESPVEDPTGDPIRETVLLAGGGDWELTEAADGTICLSTVRDGGRAGGGACIPPFDSARTLAAATRPSGDDALLVVTTEQPSTVLGAEGAGRDEARPAVLNPSLWVVTRLWFQGGEPGPVDLRFPDGTAERVMPDGTVTELPTGGELFMSAADGALVYGVGIADAEVCLFAGDDADVSCVALAPLTTGDVDLVATGTLAGDDVVVFGAHWERDEVTTNLHGSAMDSFRGAAGGSSEPGIALFLFAVPAADAPPDVVVTSGETDVVVEAPGR